MNLVSMLGDASARLLAPPICAACDASVRAGVALCVPCAATVVDVAGTPSLAAIGAYGGALAAAITRLKYDDRPDLARPLADVLSQRAARLLTLGPEVVVPIPLTPARLCERRYNQSGLVASRLASLWGLACEPVGLCRVRETRPQATLDGDARRLNVEGAFTSRAALRGRRVLLVDDVATTGATLGAARRALLANGAHVVASAVLAVAELGR